MLAEDVVVVDGDGEGDVGLLLDSPHAVSVTINGFSPAPFDEELEQLSSLFAPVLAFVSIDCHSPTVHVHSGQNHSPSGTVVKGGTRQLPWYSPSQPSHNIMKESWVSSGSLHILQPKGFLASN